MQNYLIFCSNEKYFRVFTNTSKVLSWKSKEFSDENTVNIATSESNFAPTLINYYILLDIKLNGNCLINNNTKTLLGVVNLYISQTLDWLPRYLNTDFTLGNCLFGSVTLTKNPDKYKYSGCGVRFDSR